MIAIVKPFKEGFREGIQLASDLVTSPVRAIAQTIRIHVSDGGSIVGAAKIERHNIDQRGFKKRHKSQKGKR
jgi:hypothetical protein